MGEYPNWNRVTEKTANNCTNRKCGSMRFQTGIRTSSEPQRTALLLGIGTAGTAQTFWNWNRWNRMEPHGTASRFSVSTRGFMRFL